MTIWHQFGFNSQIVIIHPHYRQHRQLLFTMMQLGEVHYMRGDMQEDRQTKDDFDGHFVILDEFDRISDNESSKFLAQILNDYPEKCIVIFSRHLPNLTEAQRSNASIFPIDEAMGLVDFFQQRKPVIEFFGFGRGAIAVNGKRREQELSDTELELLFYLHENGATNRNTLLKVLWSELPPKTAIKALHNLKPHLKDVLGLDAVLYQHGYYLLNPELEIVYDVENYRCLIELAQYAEANLSKAYFAQAYDIYKSDFLQLSNLTWAITLRRELLYTQADVQASLAQLHAQTEQKEEAAAWYSLAFKAHPVRDDVLRTLIALFYEMQFPPYAISFFKFYEDLLQKMYGVSPIKDMDAFLRAAGLK